jgi:hypothetical protein
MQTPAPRLQAQGPSGVNFQTWDMLVSFLQPVPGVRDLSRTFQTDVDD